MSPVDLVSDFDFHPDELDVREFRVPRRDVLRMDGSVFVCESEAEDVVLRHYAFLDEWFKVHVTFDRAGAYVETPARQGIPPFAVNCDISTPMLSAAAAVYAVDLFVDVPVRADGLPHEVVDLDEFDAAIAAGPCRPPRSPEQEAGSSGSSRSSRGETCWPSSTVRGRSVGRWRGPRCRCAASR